MFLRDFPCLINNLLNIKNIAHSEHKPISVPPQVRVSCCFRDWQPRALWTLGGGETKTVASDYMARFPNKRRSESKTGLAGGGLRGMEYSQSQRLVREPFPGNLSKCMIEIVSWLYCIKTYKKHLKSHVFGVNVGNDFWVGFIYLWSPYLS